MNGNYTVLVVSEDPSQSKFLESVLRQAGYRAVSAGNFDPNRRFDALEHLPDLIVCDATTLSTEDSARFCGSVRAALPAESRSIPILLLGAVSLMPKAATTAGIREIEADEVLIAPVEPPLLAASVARLIEQSNFSQALKKSEERYAVLAENANDIIFTVDLNAVFLSLNRAAERISGYRREELVGQHFSKVIAPEYWDLVLRKMPEKLAGREPANNEVTVYEAEILTKGDNRRVMLEINSRLIEKNGVPVGVLGIARDITERRESERALRESEERFKAQYKALPIPAIIWKRVAAAAGEDDFRLVDFNYAAAEISRGGIADMVGIRASEFYDYAPQIFEDLRRAFNRREIVRRETHLALRTTGEQKYVDIRCVFIAPDMVTSYYWDLTEKKRAEEALRLSEERFRLVSRATSDALWDLDLRSNSLWWSDSYYSMFGISPEQTEPAFESWRKRIHPADREKVLNSIQTAIGSGEDYWSEEYRYLLPDNSYTYISDRGHILYQEGEPVRMIGALVDISERKKAEAAMRAARERLQKQNDVLNELLKRQRLFDISLPEAVRKIDEIAARTLEAGRVSVWLLDEKKSKIQALDLYELSRDRHSQGVELNRDDYPLYFRALDEETTIVAADARNHPATSEFSKTYLVPHDIASMMDTPIRVRGRVVGVLCHEYLGDSPREWTLDEQSFAGSLASLISLLFEASERRQAEEALRHSQQQYELLVNSIDGVVWEADTETLNFTFVSPQAERFLGYPVEQWLEPDFWINHLHPDDRRPVIQTWRAKIESGKKHELEYRMIAADGREVWVRDIITIDAKDKNKVRARGLMVDITERRLAGDRLRRSEANLAAAQRITHLGSWEIVLSDLRRINNNKVHWSDEVYRIFGYEPGEVEITINRYFVEMVHPDDRRRVWKQFLEAVSQHRKLDVEYRSVLPNGIERYHHGLAEVVADEHPNRPPKLIGTVQDITERKLAEKALAAANERAIREYEKLLERIARLSESLGSARELPTIYRALYSFAADSVPCDGFFISLYDPKKNLRVPVYAYSGDRETDVSSLPAMKMSGSPNSRALSTGSIIIENDLQKEIEGNAVVTDSGMETDLCAPRSCLVVPMSVMGKVVGTVEVQSCAGGAYTPEHCIAMQMGANLVANAIENVRLLEQERLSAEQLRQAQKLESVGRLAGGIAHDFNNMLTAINGYSGLILRQLEKDNPLRPKIEEIKKAGERSAALTQQLLAFSRQQVLKPKVLDINGVVVDTSKLLQRLIGEDIQLNIIPNPKIGHIQVDPVQLTQVIMNLAVNARDAMPEGGQLTIETANVYLDTDYANQHIPTKPGAYVMLAITDTGKGMDKDTQQHIFEPFFTTKEVGKGTGLGLSTVYGIVKQSNGYIWVYSELGQGTTFKIYLPRVDVDNSSAAQNGRDNMFEDIPGGNETILLVEDEDSVRNMARQMLEACGYSIIEARDGEEALKICGNTDRQIDLLITDVVMPKMSGRELGEKLAQINRQIPQLYMSGYTDDAIIRQGRITEAMNFIQKPFTFEDLARKVRELLDAQKTGN